MVRGALAMSTHHLMAGDLWPRGNASSGIQSDKPEPVTSEFSTRGEGIFDPQLSSHDGAISTGTPLLWSECSAASITPTIDAAFRSGSDGVSLFATRARKCSSSRRSGSQLSTRGETTSPVRYWT